jgi:hypothetical protein
MNLTQAELILATVAVEVSIAQLYQAYGKRFLSHKEFWYSLRREEMEHAHRIKELEPILGHEPLSLDDRYAYFGIKQFNENLDRELARVGDMSLIDALALTVKVENSLIENLIFEARGCCTEQHKRVVASILQKSKEHALKAQTALEICRSNAFKQAAEV